MYAFLKKDLKHGGKLHESKIKHDMAHLSRLTWDVSGFSGNVQHD